MNIITNIILAILIAVALFPLSVYAQSDLSESTTTLQAEEPEEPGDGSIRVDHEIEVDGICYNIVDEKGLEVAARSTMYAYLIDSQCAPNPYIALSEPELKYSGDIIIPESAYVESLGKELPVKSIGLGAFAYCDELKSVVIPASVTSIGTQAFYECSSLSNVALGENLNKINDVAFCKCESLQSISLPESLQSFGIGVFYGSGLESLTIPSGVRSMSVQLVENCTNLKEVTSLIVDPWSVQWDNDYRHSTSINPECILMVPAGSVKQYKLDPDWSGYKEISAIPGSSDEEFIPLIHTDWIWVYRYQGKPTSYNSADGNVEYGVDITVESEFSDNKLMAGRRFHHFVTRPIDPADGSVKFADYWLRASHGKVYLSIISPIFTDYPPTIEVDHGSPYASEFPLYDFTKEESDTYPGCIMYRGTQDMLLRAECSVSQFGQETIAGKPYISYQATLTSDGAVKHIAVEKVIEGIGSLGYFSYFSATDSDPMHTEKFTLLRVLDKTTREVIYDNPASVYFPEEEISVSADKNYFNLQGQPVSVPVKGELYIVRDSRGARKVVF